MLKKIFYPTLKKIIVSLLIYIIQFFVFGFPVLTFPLCEMGVACPFQLEFISFNQLVRSVDFFNKGIWFPSYIYVIELAVSYVVLSILIYIIEKNEENSNT
jgi:hypothetical protein